MAIKSPAAVAIKASATPPVTACGCPRPVSDMMPKELIMPVMVPSNPKRGARVMMVSRMVRRFLRTGTSAWAATSNALGREGFRCSRPAVKTRAVGKSTFLPSSVALANSRRWTSCSSSSTGPRDRALCQKMMRSMTTASEMIEQARSGTITGPPLMRMPIKSNTFIALS